MLSMQMAGFAFACTYYSNRTPDPSVVSFDPSSSSTITLGNLKRLICYDEACWGSETLFLVESYETVCTSDCDTEEEEEEDGEEEEEEEE